MSSGSQGAQLPVFGIAWAGLENSRCLPLGNITARSSSLHPSERQDDRADQLVYGADGPGERPPASGGPASCLIPVGDRHACISLTFVVQAQSSRPSSRLASLRAERARPVAFVAATSAGTVTLTFKESGYAEEHPLSTTHSA